jgi:hypothetical protein
VSVWDDYLRLLDDLGGLDDARVQGVAAAEAAYQQESRRLQMALDAAEREVHELTGRNTRLQAGSRELARRLSLAVPPAGGRPLLEGPALRDAVTSTEYDREQLRRSLDHLDATPSAPVAAPIPAAPPPTAPFAPVAPPAASRTRVPHAAVVAVAVVVVLLLVLIVVVL